MRALQHAALHELAQVAPDGLLGDREVAGQAADLDAAVGPGAGEDLPLALVRLHDPTSSAAPEPQ